MDESHRPVKLRKVVLGFPCNPNQTEFKFDLSLNYKMANIIQTYSDQKPALVVCRETGVNCVFFFGSVFVVLFRLLFGPIVMFFCSFALPGKEPSSQLQFWPRMLDSSWALSTSKGMFLPYPYLHVHTYATIHQNILSSFILVNLPDLITWSSWLYLLLFPILFRLIKYANSILDLKLRGESFGQPPNPMWNLNGKISQATDFETCFSPDPVRKHMFIWVWL